MNIKNLQQKETKENTQNLNIMKTEIFPKTFIFRKLKKTFKVVRNCKTS